MKKFRIYLDTSVIGGCFDPEFQEASNKLMEMIRLGIFTGVVSNVTVEELQGAPEHVRDLLKNYSDDEVIRLSATDEVLALTKSYLDAKVVTSRFESDAAHVAYATIHHADMIVSWNFRHLVNFQRIHAFNAVNMQLGYGLIDIRTPKEVIYGREEEKGF
jgi:hypothetical protein